ncbi:hypothetical protein CROQUDRAFT_681754 [Cronartium quercuum f. sp. fusiforme G11]|uniref:DUF6589 domain-containing protein n=1 Tax=Cronartium quercuum f. sp. fusiforme G11 TaxID=708437 RepID=A0A9P6NN37_9BASI|nr:hypothetical protein CROQUDRAFT_681754 [Cronartium quercuum f. sp. fusiforme G11]
MWLKDAQKKTITLGVLQLTASNFLPKPCTNIFLKRILHSLPRKLHHIEACYNKIKTSPPIIDLIPFHEPRIFMLHLMDMSEGSTKGIWQVLGKIAQHFGLSLDQMSKHIQLTAGDLATCKTFEALQKKFYQAGFPKESLQNLLTILGATHTLWNLAQKILSHHWGNLQEHHNTGIWKAWKALALPRYFVGGKINKMPANMNFSTVMQVVKSVHTATLVTCCRKCMSIKGHNVDLSKKSVAEELVEMCFQEFCSTQVL